MANVAVTEYTKTATANPNVRQTIGRPEKIQPGRKTAEGPLHDQEKQRENDADQP
jgi:hypothetical protein